MTDLATPATPPKRRGSRILWAVVGLAVVFSICAWISVFVGYQMEVSRSTWIILVTVAALSIEAVIWSTAAAVGLKVFEARRKIWRALTGRGWNG